MGLGITIAIALHMDWEQPRWTAINVALVGMFTVGLSLNNAIVRILGTITAGLMTLALLGLFGQDRWLYVLTLSIWMGICTYMMGGKKFEGYWMMAGFATAIVAVDAGLDAVDTFETVMLTLWLCYLALFYFNPMPGGGNLVAMAAASAMAISLAPQLPIKMFLPVLASFKAQ